MAELHHQLDQYLSFMGLGFARSDPTGCLLFDTAEGLSLGAMPIGSDRIRLFACAGYTSAEQLRGLHEGIEAHSTDAGADAQAPFERLDQDAVVRWSAEGADWAVAVDRTSGAVTLSMFLSSLPRRSQDWQACLDGFVRQFDDWQGRLRDEPPALSPHAVEPFPGLTAGHVLLC